MTDEKERRMLSGLLKSKEILLLSSIIDEPDAVNSTYCADTCVALVQNIFVYFKY
jgi:hypothetical protein